MVMSREEQYWCRDSNIVLKQENNIVIGKYTLNKYYRAEFGFMPFHSLAKESLWKYRDAYAENWMAPSFDDSQWTPSKKSVFPAPDAQTVTRFYRHTMAVGDLTGFAAFELAVNSRFGIVMYANGEEIYRKNLPADATATTRATDDDGDYSFKRAFASRRLLGTSVVFAVEIHFGEEPVEADEFDAFMNLVPSGTHRTFDGTSDGTHQDDYWDELGPNIWDGARNNKWFMNGLPAYNTYVFNNDRAEFFNTYSITTGTYDSNRRPRSWKVEVSDDGSTWYLVDYRSDVSWSSHGETKTFTIAQMKRGYRQLKWTLLSSGNTDAELSEVSFYAVDMPIAPSDAIDYDGDKYFYPSQSVSIEPKAKGFYDMSISPSLVSGLSFNANSGEVTGTVSSSAQPDTYTYTVTGKRYETGSTVYTGTLVIVVTECQGDHRRLSIKTHISTNRDAPFYRILQGATEVARVDTNVIYGTFGSTTISSRSQTDSFCLPEGDYALEFGNNYHIDWTPGSYVTLFSTLPDGSSFPIGTYSGMRLGSSIPFSLRFVMSGETAGWTYLADGTVPENWFATDFANEWSAIPETLPSVSQSVWLFRRQVTIPADADVDAYELRLAARAGVVVYLNGIEVYRRNVAGAVTAASTSSSSSEDLNTFAFVGLAGANYLHAGANTFAVAVVNANAAAHELDFSATMVLRSAVRIISHGVSLSAEASDGDADNLFDGKVNDRLTADLDDETFFQFTWTGERMEQINKYCLVSSSEKRGTEPKAFNVSVTVDGETWTRIATQSGVFFTERGQRRCFYIANPVAIRGMRVDGISVETEGADTVRLGLFDFLLENTDNIPALSYDNVVVEGLAGAAITPVAPTTDFYTSFTASPALPEGLFIGTSGIIYGTVSEAVEYASYSITGVSVTGASSTVVVTVNIAECRVGEQLTYVHFVETGSHGRYMNYKMTNVDSGEVMGEYDGFENYDTTIYHPYCFTASNYMISFDDNSKHSWPGEVQIVSGSTLIQSFSVMGTFKEETFFPLVFYDDRTEWSYKVDAEDPPADWYLPTFVNTWPKATYEHIPAAQAKGSYYCVRFNLYTTASYGSVIATVTTRGGFILYVNGNEMTRFRMAEGATSHTTESTEETETAEAIQMAVAFPMAHIKNQDNLMCLEIHTKTLAATNDFHVAIGFGENTEDMLVDGTASYSHAGYYDSTWDERNFHALDKNINTKFTALGTAIVAGTEPVYVQWHYNGMRHETLNFLRFYAGNTRARSPRNIDIMASNDGNTWSTLHHQEVSWTQGGWGQSREIPFSNTKPYRYYRVQVDTSSSEGIEIGEVYLGMKSTTLFCPSQDGFTAAYVNSKAIKSCGVGYSGLVYRTCLSTLNLAEEEDRQCTLNPPTGLRYGTRNTVNLIFQKEMTFPPTVNGLIASYAIEPQLPEGLAFDTTTGVLSGAIQSVVSEVTFTITATNEAGSARAVVTLNSRVVDCEALPPYPATAHGKWTPATCPLFYRGYAMVMCVGGEFQEPDLTHCSARTSTVFTYPLTTITAHTGEPIVAMDILTDGAFTSYAVEPALPEGITLAENGHISGSTMVASPETAYVVTAQNTIETKTVTVTLTVLDNGCAQLDTFPAAGNGAYSESAEACPAHHTGVAKRLCTNGVFGTVDTSACHMTAPAGFAYSPATQTVVSGSAVLMAPSVTGIVSSYAVTPELPAGISINARGVISGKAQAIGTTTHTVTAANAESSAMATVTITVTAAACEGVDGVSITDGEKWLGACPPNYVGNSYRLCTNGVLGVEQFDECVQVVPADLTYNVTDMVFVVNHDASTYFPSYAGRVDEFTVAPELPLGLELNKETGQIFGYPEEVAEAASYTVTATNTAGSTSAILTLAVENPRCEAMEGFPETKVGESVTFDCLTLPGYKGTSTRTCVLSKDGMNAVWSTPTEWCIEKKLDWKLLVGILLILIGVLLVVWGILMMVKRQTKTLHKTATPAKPVPAPAPAPAPAVPAPAPAPAPAPVPVAAPPAPAPAPAAPAPAPPAPAPAPAAPKA